MAILYHRLARQLQHVIEVAGEHVRDGAHDETQAKEEQHEAEDGERAAAATHTPPLQRVEEIDRIHLLLGGEADAEGPVVAIHRDEQCVAADPLWK